MLRLHIFKTDKLLAFQKSFRFGAIIYLQRFMVLSIVCLLLIVILVVAVHLLK